MGPMPLPIAQTTRPEAAAWYAARFLNNTLLQWAGLLAFLLVTFIVGRVVSFVLDRAGRWSGGRARGRALGLVLGSFSRPAAMLVFAGGLCLVERLGIVNLDFGPDRDLTAFWRQVAATIAAIAVGWAVYRLVDVLELFLSAWTSRTRTQLDDQLVPLVRKSLRVFVVIIAALFIAQNIYGWSISSLLAGLGLGGLAFALAAQDALKNLFGSLTIFADRPFQLGDWVRIGEHEGIIEEVGFRSTRLRTFPGHLVTIPNAKVADTAVENVSRRPSVRRVLNVTVTYDTPPEKMARAVEVLREMLAARREHFPPDRPGEVHFNDFNAASLNIIVYYWFTPADYWQSLAFAHAFNMELLRRYNEEGIEFAFPTQTLYLKQDSAFAISGGGAGGGADRPGP